MIPRVLEPEVMDAAAEAADYDAMDHSDVNRRFVDDLLVFTASSAPGAASAAGGEWLDVGTGTGLIPIELCRRSGTARVLAIDLADKMLALARRNVAAAGLAERIDLQRMDAKQTGRPAGAFTGIMSNSIVHHIPEPLDVMREMTRLLQPAGVLFIRDLARPGSAEEVETIVKQYAGQETSHQQQLFRQSLHAALTVDEARQLAAACGWPDGAVQRTSDRHWTLAARR